MAKAHSDSHSTPRTLIHARCRSTMTDAAYTWKPLKRSGAVQRIVIFVRRSRISTEIGTCRVTAYPSLELDHGNRIAFPSFPSWLARPLLSVSSLPNARNGAMHMGEDFATRVGRR